MEEAFALAEAEAKLKAALNECQARFDKAKMPDRRNEDWRFGRPHVYAKQLVDTITARDNHNYFERMVICDKGNAATRLTRDDDDLLQTEMLMQTIGSDALLKRHIERFEDGYSLYIEEDTTEVIELVYETRSFCSPSTFIMVAPGVKAEVHIIYSCLEIGNIFAACNIQVAAGAELKVRVQAESDGSDGRCMIITNIQNMGGKVMHLTEYRGLRWAREETVAELYSPGSETKLFSANRLVGDSVLDQHTRQIHHVGGASSDLLYKNVVDDNATAILPAISTWPPEPTTQMLTKAIATCCSVKKLLFIHYPGWRFWQTKCVARTVVPVPPWMMSSFSTSARAVFPAAMLSCW